MSDDNKAPTFGTLAPLSWDVRVDGDRQAIEPLAGEIEARASQWRAP